MPTKLTLRVSLSMAMIYCLVIFNMAHKQAISLQTERERERETGTPGTSCVNAIVRRNTWAERLA